MSSLAGLWWTSLLMAGLALVWMTGLVIARALRERAGVRHQAERTTVRAVCLEILQGVGEATSQLEPYRRRPGLMAETLLEFLAIVRGEQREALVSAYRSWNIDDRMRERLSQGGRHGRLAAAEAVAAFPGPDTIAALERAFRELRDADIRLMAVRSLIDLEAPPPLRMLLADMQARGVSDSLLYLPVVQRVTKVDPEQALDLFRDKSLAPTARALLAAALGQSGDYRAIEPLCETAGDEDRGLRISAVRGLGALAHPAAADAIIRALDDPEWEVRSTACEAARQVGLISALPALRRRLADTVWWVRFQAAEAMAGMGQKGVECLRLSAGADIDIARRAASMALAEKGLTEPVGA